MLLQYESTNVNVLNIVSDTKYNFNKIIFFLIQCLILYNVLTFVLSLHKHMKLYETIEENIEIYEIIFYRFNILLIKMNVTGRSEIFCIYILNLHRAEGYRNDQTWYSTVRT